MVKNVLQGGIMETSIIVDSDYYSLEEKINYCIKGKNVIDIKLCTAVEDCQYQPIKYIALILYKEEL